MKANITNVPVNDYRYLSRESINQTRKIDRIVKREEKLRKDELNRQMKDFMEQAGESISIEERQEAIDKMARLAKMIALYCDFYTDPDNYIELQALKRKYRPDAIECKIITDNMNRIKDDWAIVYDDSPYGPKPDLSKW